LPNRFRYILFGNTPRKITVATHGAPTGRLGDVTDSRNGGKVRANGWRNGTEIALSMKI